MPLRVALRVEAWSCSLEYEPGASTGDMPPDAAWRVLAQACAGRPCTTIDPVVLHTSQHVDGAALERRLREIAACFPQGVGSACTLHREGVGFRMELHAGSAEQARLCFCKLVTASVLSALQAQPPKRGRVGVKRHRGASSTTASLHTSRERRRGARVV